MNLSVNNLEATYVNLIKFHHHRISTLKNSLLKKLRFNSRVHGKTQLTLTKMIPELDIVRHYKNYKISINTLPAMYDNLAIIDCILFSNLNVQPFRGQPLSHGQTDVPSTENPSLYRKENIK